MKKISFLIIAILFPAISLAAAGVVHVESNYDVKTTADRLEKALTEKGMTVFNRIDHAGGAEGVGIELRPTELIIFGNPKVGSPLMKCSQSAAIDLPQKALIWEGTDGKTHITYNDPTYIKERHAVTGCDEVLQKINKALANFSKGAAGVK
jgi:uncharacterized protein (DUF302 family)